MAEEFESYESDPAMVILSYGSDYPMGTRFPLSTYEVLGAYHSSAVTDPSFPTRGKGRSMLAACKSQDARKKTHASAGGRDDHTDARAELKQ